MTIESQAALGDAAGESRRFVIEHARAEDAGRIAPLFDAYRQFYGSAPDLVGAHAFIAARLERAESVVLLARALTSESEPTDAVGFAQLYPSFSSVSLGAILVLNDLFVLPSWRRSSVARSLIAEGTRYAERVGAIRIHLSTQSTNVPALRLYQSLDFIADLEFTHMSLALRSPGS
jgi:ribosomal protein S18 acetylase RimI-like enzyme